MAVTPGELLAPGRMASSFPSPSRTGAYGTSRPSPRACKFCTRRYPPPRSALTGLQAAIAAVHAEAARPADTDWTQILALYQLLDRVAPSPIFTLNRVVAVAMERSADQALQLLEALERRAQLAGHHRVDAVRGHLLELLGRPEAAAASYEAAARRTTSIPEQRYLRQRAHQMEEQHAAIHPRPRRTRT